LCKDILLIISYEIKRKKCFGEFKVIRHKKRKTGKKRVYIFTVFQLSRIEQKYNKEEFSIVFVIFKSKNSSLRLLNGSFRESAGKK